MKKCAIILTLLFALTALCLPVFAEEIEPAPVETEVQTEPVRLGTFTVLHAQYNRGMGDLNMFLMREGDGDISPIFEVDMNFPSDGELLPCEALSDGSSDGDAAKVLFETSHEIKPGTMVVLFADPVYPDPYFYSENTLCNYIADKHISQIRFGSLWRNPDPEHIAGVYAQLNACDIIAQDRKVQFEYSVVDGEIKVERIELEPEEYLPRNDGLTVFYAKFNGNSAELLIGGYYDGKPIGYYINAENTDDIAMSQEDLKDGAVVDIIFRYDIGWGQLIHDGSKIWGIRPNADESPLTGSEYAEVLGALNGYLRDWSQSMPQFAVNPSGAMAADAPSAPETGVTFALFPAMVAALTACVFKKIK